MRRKNGIIDLLRKKASGKSIRIKNTHPDKAILLSGSGRSGTTWLANIIAACPGFGISFEPFDYRKVPEAKDFPLRAYLRPDGNYPRHKAFVEKVLRGKIHNVWTDREKHHFFIWRYLLKTIRANLMLSWIDGQFGCPIVYIIRHPCAVVLSRVKLNWDTHLEVFLNQKELMSDYLVKYEAVIREAKNPIQKHTIMWCIENLVPLSQIAQHDWIFCAYENLCSNSEEEIDRIFVRLGLRRTKRVNRTLNSFYQTRSDSAVRKGRDPLNDWKVKLEKDEIKEILSIVHKFGIGIYGDSSMPVPGSLERVKANG